MADGADLKQRPILTAGQLAAVRSLTDNTHPVWPKATWTMDSSQYTSEEHFQLEQEKIFRRAPVPISPSVQLKAGHYLCTEGYGVPVLLTRDLQGKAHAFLNGCRHRGAQLTDEVEPQKGKLVICPYHAWSYALDGRLVGIPREESFGELPKDQLNLIPLPCREEGGVIWVILDHKAPADFSTLTPEIIHELDAIGGAEMHLFAKGVHEVNCNWKLIMDTFLEGYHVIRLHSTTLGDLFEDATQCNVRIGHHIRQVSGRGGFRLDKVDNYADSFKSLRKIAAFVYNLFPCGVFIQSPDYANLLLLMPQGVGKTRVENYMLTLQAPDERLQEKWSRSLALTDGAAYKEDFKAGELAYKGLKAGVAPTVYMGGMESAIPLWHGSIDEYLQNH